MSSRNTPAGASGELRILANRRNALKSTGPRTTAGKRRAALNARRRGLCSEELEQQFRARGEDPREFRRLHRDLIAIFHPKDGGAMGVVELMAHTWWEKARRIRNWVGAGQPSANDLDTRLERLLTLLAHGEALQHRWWVHRLAAVLGRPLGFPPDVRRKIEARLTLFGAKPAQRKYPRQTPREQRLKKFARALSLTLARERHRPHRIQPQGRTFGFPVRPASGENKPNPAKAFVVKEMQSNGAERTHWGYVPLYQHVTAVFGLSLTKNECAARASIKDSEERASEDAGGDVVATNTIPTRGTGEGFTHPLLQRGT